MAQVVEVAQRLDPDCSLDGLPVPTVEVAEVEVAAARVREEQQAVLPRPELVERLDRDRLQRNRASAQRVLVCLTRPFAYARRIWTTPAARSMSRYSSANSSEGRSPVAAANTTIGPKVGPSQSASARICSQDSNGRRSRHNRQSVIFLFPDSHDQVDPSYDFSRESSSLDRVRQRDDRYAHEVISPAPYDGILLSKALIDGKGSKYTFAQRQRLYRLGTPPLPARYAAFSGARTSSRSSMSCENGRDTPSAYAIATPRKLRPRNVRRSVLG